MKRKLIHLFVGHIPYYVYTKNIGTPGEEKVYYCTNCDITLCGGVYHWLFDEKTGKREA